MNYKINAVILAGGKGTRMNNPELPKCATPFLGKPIINHIIDTLHEVKVNKIVVVVGYKKEKLIEVLPEDCIHVTQENQLGTADAMMTTKNVLIDDKDSITLIIPGDMPLITKEMVANMVDAHIKNGNVLTVMTSILDDPMMYGRIVRKGKNISRIVEYKDCNEEEKKIKEINVGVYAVDNQLLFDALNKVNNNNKQHEYYLTDIVAILGEEYKVDSYVVKNDCHVVGINDMVTLKELENSILNK